MLNVYVPGPTVPAKVRAAVEMLPLDEPITCTT
jgi:hypothetical protein